MKRQSMKALVIFIVAIVGLGCMTPWAKERQNLQVFCDVELQPGMTREQVIAKWGEPQAKKAVFRYIDADEMWYYGKPGVNHDITVFFGNGRVVRVYADWR